MNAAVRVQCLAIMFQAFNGSLFGIENIAVVWLGARLVLDSGFSVGMSFAFIAYKQTFIMRIVYEPDQSISSVHSCIKQWRLLSLYCILRMDLYEESSHDVWRLDKNFSLGEQ